MDSLKRLAIVLAGIFLFHAPTALPGKGEGTPTPPPHLLQGRHGITIHGGLLSQVTTETDVSGGTVTEETRVSGFLGSLSYTHWPVEDWSFGLGSGVMEVKTSSSVRAGEEISESAVVIPMLIAVSYQPRSLALGPSVRPYISVAVGSYLGVASNQKVDLGVETETVTEAVVGARPQIGIDILLGRRFKTGAAVGYHFVDDFDRKIGDDDNYSGPEFLVGFGILLGG